MTAPLIHGPDLAFGLHDSQGADVVLVKALPDRRRFDAPIERCPWRSSYLWSGGRGLKRGASPAPVVVGGHWGSGRGLDLAIEAAPGSWIGWTSPLGAAAVGR